MLLHFFVCINVGHEYENKTFYSYLHLVLQTRLKTASMANRLKKNMLNMEKITPVHPWETSK